MYCYWRLRFSSRAAHRELITPRCPLCPPAAHSYLRMRLFTPPHLIYTVTHRIPPSSYTDLQVLPVTSCVPPNPTLTAASAPEHGCVRLPFTQTKDPYKTVLYFCTRPKPRPSSSTPFGGLPSEPKQACPPLVRATPVSQSSTPPSLAPAPP